MVLFNYSTKELTAKVVYYGPGLCGKTTNLQYIHANLPETVKGKMLSLATKTDRTLFFDFLPLDLGEIRGMKTRVQLYTVPGQVFYNETRKLVLKGADGIVFVADSQAAMIGPNVESFRNLEENLKAHGLRLADMPHVIQFNKRDLPKLAGLDELNAALNVHNAPFFESVATTGIGVQETLKGIVRLVLLHLSRKYDPAAASASAVSAAAAQPAAPARQAAAAPAARVAVSSAPRPTPGRTNARGDEERSIPLSDYRVPAARPVAAATIEPSRPGRPLPPPPDFTGRSSAAQAESTIDLGSVDLDTLPELRPERPAPTREPAGATEVVYRHPVLSAAGDGEVPPRLGTEILLTELAEGASLFSDPDLDVAQLEPGGVREIVVPVEMASGGANRRFSLSVRLTLTPVE